jgi:hypothetical protein
MSNAHQTNPSPQGAPTAAAIAEAEAIIAAFTPHAMDHFMSAYAVMIPHLYTPRTPAGRSVLAGAVEGYKRMLNAVLVTPGPAHDELVRRVIANPEIFTEDPMIPINLYIQFKDSFPHSADPAVG